MRLPKFILSVLFGLFLATSPLSAVSEAAKETFHEKYGESILPGWEIDVNGRWEAAFEMDGENYRADFTQDGQWVETERNMDFDELPDEVKVAVKSEFGDRAISEIEEVDSAEKGLFYDVEFADPGPNTDVEFYPDGTRVTGVLEKVTGVVTDMDDLMTGIQSGQKKIYEMTRAELLFEFGLNLLTIIIFAYGIYYLRHHDHKMMFLLLAFNLFLFPIFLLNSVLTAGFGFTIFALLALVRLRSENFDKAEVAYLLGAVSLTFINSQLTASVEIGASVVVLLTAYIADHRKLWSSTYQTTEIRYPIEDSSRMLDRAYLSREISRQYNVHVNEILINRVSRKVVRLTVIYQDPPHSEKEAPETSGGDKDESGKN